MPKVNQAFFDLKRNYVFPIIEEKLLEMQSKFQGETILNFGVADVALPLSNSVKIAIHDALEEMCNRPIGYAPSRGYPFLREAIAKHLFNEMDIAPEEIFISDGANTDVANLGELFDDKITVGVTDPTYPVYLDSMLLRGAKKRITLLPCEESNGLKPTIPKEKIDLIFLCHPNNPTGTCFTFEELKNWVDYAKVHDAILCIDSAYRAFIQDPNIPESIYQIPGAKEVAIEVGSFSKSCGFTGLRCGYTVIPKTLTAKSGKKKIDLHALWLKRQNTKFNGVAYPIQKGALSTFDPQVQKELKNQIQYYMGCAKFLKETLLSKNQTVFGADNAPFLFWKIPSGFTSWGFFDKLLAEIKVIAIPGSGFGEKGEGFVRLSAFTSMENAELFKQRLEDWNPS